MVRLYLLLTHSRSASRYQKELRPVSHTATLLSLKTAVTSSRSPLVSLLSQANTFGSCLLPPVIQPQFPLSARTLRPGSGGSWLPLDRVGRGRRQDSRALDSPAQQEMTRALPCPPEHRSVTGTLSQVTLCPAPGTQPLLAGAAQTPTVCRRSPSGLTGFSRGGSQLAPGRLLSSESCSACTCCSCLFPYSGLELCAFLLQKSVAKMGHP